MTYESVSATIPINHPAIRTLMYRDRETFAAILVSVGPHIPAPSNTSEGRHTVVVDYGCVCYGGVLYVYAMVVVCSVCMVWSLLFLLLTRVLPRTQRKLIQTVNSS